MIVLKNIEELVGILKTKDVNITIGNFDGVHLGHQDFLNEIKNKSKDENTKFIVITFVPHPGQALKGLSGFLINSYDDRRELLQRQGVDYLLEVDFTRDFSSLSPREFVEQYISIFPKIKCVYLGHDFSFGANRSGDHLIAQKIFKEKNILLNQEDEFKLNGKTVSSSEIRKALKQGNIIVANELLGRAYYLSGRVIKGQGRGKQIGFPTANLDREKSVILPTNGVYLTKTKIHDMVYFSVTNVGGNPTFNSENEIHVESHLLNFSRDIYGEVVTLYFYDKIREEKKFNTVNELINQIKLDVEFAEKYFKQTKN
jgi:riboflavin kinase/FMN adenylyltransferase